MFCWSGWGLANFGWACSGTCSALAGWLVCVCVCMCDFVRMALLMCLAVGWLLARVMGLWKMATTIYISFYNMTLIVSFSLCSSPLNLGRTLWPPWPTECGGFNGRPTSRLLPWETGSFHFLPCATLLLELSYNAVWQWSSHMKRSGMHVSPPVPAEVLVGSSINHQTCKWMSEWVSLQMTPAPRGWMTPRHWVTPSLWGFPVDATWSTGELSLPDPAQSADL